MSSSPSSTSSFPSRKLLLQIIPRVSTGSPISLHAGTKEPESMIDANVIMVLSVLVCALICVLVLNSIIRCALGYSNRLARDSGDNRPIQSVANTGIRKKALKTFPVVTYSSGGLKLPGLDTECVICLSEFAQGERIRILPKCNHGFHIKCIGKWLSSHSTCPTCRHCLIETCEKIINGGSSQPRSLIPLSQPPHSSTIVPLEHEGIVRNVADIC
ncbi:RING-H2 finger protein ATL78-like [Papaver somniferum]|uniref:RING-H2 finger protein ATL78-like n=1 Tax=Papaver somniferum TaxID=3469 RepID=UPI000E6FBEE7|nr:RING-H2 finger protein ATL78-like [Papaver somniferum]